MDNSKILNSFHQMNVEHKRSEISELVKEIGKIIDALLNSEMIQSNINVTDYEQLKQAQNNVDSIKENEMLTFMYGDLWNLKNSLLVLLALKKNGINNEQDF